jgi:hypothetical protein
MNSNLSPNTSHLLDEVYHRAYEELGRPDPATFIDLMKKRAQAWTERDRLGR